MRSPIALLLIALSPAQDVESYQARAEREAKKVIELALSHPLARPEAIVLDPVLNLSQHLTSVGSIFVMANHASLYVGVNRETNRLASFKLQSIHRPVGFDPKTAPTITVQDAAEIGEAVIQQFVKPPYKVELQNGSLGPSYRFSLRLRQGEYLFDQFLVESVEIDPWSGFPLSITGIPPVDLPQPDPEHSTPKISLQLARQRALAAYVATNPIPRSIATEGEFVVIVPAWIGPSYARFEPIHDKNSDLRRTMLFYKIAVGSTYGDYVRYQAVYVDATTGRAVAIREFRADPVRHRAPLPEIVDAEGLIVGDSFISITDIQESEWDRNLSGAVTALLMFPKGDNTPVQLFPKHSAFLHAGTVYRFQCDVHELLAAKPAAPLPKFASGASAKQSGRSFLQLVNTR